MRKKMIAAVMAVVIMFGFSPYIYATELSEDSSSHVGADASEDIPIYIEAPAKVTAKRVNYNTVKVGWSKVEDATEYEVYRYNSSTKKYQRIKTITGGDVTSYKNTGLTTGKTYSYKVKAKMSIVQSAVSESILDTQLNELKVVSPYSSKVSIKPIPSKVAIASVKATGRGAVKVAWKGVPGASGYYLYRSTAKNKGYKKISTVSKNARNYTNKNLTLNKTYYYKVKAYRTVGKGKVSGIVSSYKGTKNALKYKKAFAVKAYAYCDRGYTASGLKAGPGRIAVDPRVIPLGTKLYVQGYGFCVAADTGGAIKGKVVDLWMKNNSKCRSWGVKYPKLYVLK